MLGFLQHIPDYILNSNDTKEIRVLSAYWADLQGVSQAFGAFDVVDPAAWVRDQRGLRDRRQLEADTVAVRPDAVQRYVAA